MSFRKWVVLAVMLVFASGFILGGCVQEAKKEAAGGKKETKVESSRSGEELLTAQQAFRIAREEAQKWASDAALIEISNFGGSSEADGRAARWKFRFVSRSKGAGLDVHISKGEVLQTMDVDYENSEFIKGNWIDSPEAMDVAKKYFKGSTARNYWLGLGSSDGVVSWSVKCSREEGQPIWVKVNASTGKVMKTWEGY